LPRLRAAAAAFMPYMPAFSLLPAAATRFAAAAPFIFEPISRHYFAITPFSLPRFHCRFSWR